MEKNFKIGIMPGGALHPVIGFDTVSDAETEVEVATTVGDLFEVTGLELGDGFTIRANGEDVTLDTPISLLNDGTTIIATRAIRGN